MPSSAVPTAMRVSLSAWARPSAASIPVGWNIGFTLAQFAVNLYQFFFLPLWLLPRNPAWALTLIPLAAFNTPLWCLIHEAMHGTIHPARQVANAIGRVLGIAFGSPFLLLRVAHLMHHKYNRSRLERLEAYDPSETTWGKTAIGYYLTLLGGLYLLALTAPLMWYLPYRTLQRVVQTLFATEPMKRRISDILIARRGAIQEIRIDMTLILALLTASAVCYGSHWWMLIAILAVRAVNYSFLDYLYHYGSPIDNVLHAYNVWLPKPLSWFLLHFNYHGVHHSNPSLPWIHLPAGFARQGGQFAGSYFRMALRQLRGPIPMTQLPILLPGTAQ